MVDLVALVIGLIIGALLAWIRLTSLGHVFSTVSQWIAGGDG